MAIELCIPLLQLYSPSELPAILEHSLDYLSEGRRDVNRRHRSLETALDWSYNLLSGPERSMLAGLSVFAGGFDLTAAQSICAAAAETRFAGTFRALVEKGLVSKSQEDSPNRFRLFQATREYLVQKRIAIIDFEAVCERHANYFYEFAERADLELRSREQMIWFGRLEADYGNLLLALRYLRDHERYTDVLRMAISLMWFWTRRGDFFLGREVVESVIDSCGTTVPACYPRALHRLGWFTFLSGDWRKANSLHSRSLHHARRLGDRACETYALSDLGLSERWLGNVEVGTKYCLAAVSEARELDSPHLLSRALIWAYATTGGDFDSCYPEAELMAAAELAASTGDTWIYAHAFAGLGDLYGKRGLYEKARGSYADALRGFGALGDRMFLAWTLDRMGRVEARCGNTNEALTNTLKALQLFDQYGDEIDVGLIIAQIAEFLGEEARNGSMAEFGGAASRMISRRPGDDLSKTPQVKQGRERLAGLERDFPSEWMRGSGLSRAEVVERISRYIENHVMVDSNSDSSCTRLPRESRRISAAPLN